MPFIKGVWRNWSTRTTQNRMRKLLWVRVPPRPQMLKKESKDYLWTPQLAYVVGLITTDGCLSSDGRHVIMRSSDTEQLANFKECLGIENKIERTEYKGNISFRVQYGNVVFYRWLMKIGLTPNKSKTIEKISVPKKYFIDFLRGHLDGDGSITAYTDYYNVSKNPKYIYQRMFVRFISASEKHIDWLHKEIEDILKIKGRKHITNSKNDKTVMYIIKFMKKDSIKLLRKIYYKKDIPSLSRKRILAEKYI